MRIGTEDSPNRESCECAFSLTLHSVCIVLSDLRIESEFLARVVGRYIYVIIVETRTF